MTTLLLSQALKPTSAEAVTVVDYVECLDGPCPDEPLTGYEQFNVIIQDISFFAVIFMFIPWFSLAGYWRQKKTEQNTRNKKRPPL